MGVPVSTVRLGEAASWIAAWAEGQTPRLVCTVNPEFIIEARRNPAFLRALERSDLNVADGIGVVLAGRILGLPIYQRVAGVDLVEAVCDLAGYRELRVFLLGGAPGVAETAAIRLTARHRGLQIAGCSSASADPHFDADTIAEINSTDPHILLVAFGAPRQELWIDRNLVKLGCGVAIGVGGTLDYIAGRSRRAPRMLSVVGLEWAFRLIQDPRRWRRMSVLPVFALLALKEAFRSAARR